MKQITPDIHPAHQKAASSSATAADRKIPAGLTPREERLLKSTLEDHPELSAEKALAMLREAGA